MQLLTEYFKLQEQIFAYFGYVEDWVTIPLLNLCEMNWHYRGTEQSGKVWYSDLALTPEVLKAGTALYSAVLYTQRFLPKWIYRADDYTMICIDTQCDGKSSWRCLQTSGKSRN